ncbi:MAG TPA: hypothetical protein VK162_21455 [Streptosporangiaceae bacterium]|nr:hypothetical protein [Streptosporangiaceae bacterium]
MTPRADQAAASAGTPSRDDGVTIRTCPACGQAFTRSGRRKYCSQACRQAAWRRGHAPAAPVTPVPRPGRKRAVTVYECGQCGARQLGTQRCEDCHTFMTATGIGGICPFCDEPVAITELTTGNDGQGTPPGGGPPMAD